MAFNTKRGRPKTGWRDRNGGVNPFKFDPWREIGDAADGFDLFEAGERVGEGNDVDGRTRVCELGHAQEDAAVGIEGEIVGLDRFGGFGVGGVIEQDGAEDGALGRDVGGQAGFEGEIGGLHLVFVSRRRRLAMNGKKAASTPRSM